MKIVNILILGLFLCLNLKGQVQYNDIRHITEPLYVSSYITRDVPLGKFINHDKELITLADFKKKLVILTFWFPQCSGCIAQFPKEDSLQRLFKKDVQFITVTHESEEVVKKFMAKWEMRNNINFSIPMIVEDTLLMKSFRMLYNPHYVWILPDGKVIGQTSESFINAENIKKIIEGIN